MKPEVRKIAARLGLVTSDKKDSTGICFIGERKFKDFLETYLPALPGRIQSTDGEDIGMHSGLMFYTRGQRQGLGIGGRAGRPDAPWFVVAKDLDKNVLIVGQGNENKDLFSAELKTLPAAWISGKSPKMPLPCTAKIRYRQADQACEVSAAANGGLVVKFKHPQRAVTPGQYVVFYQGERCLGGAIIDGFS
jgi:tRNA-specific 2-thiouridylase